MILVENASVPTDPRVWPECSTLHAAGWNVTVVCPKGRTADRSAREIVDGVEVHRFDAIESQGGAMGYLREYRAALARIRRIVGEIARTRHVDVVQACNPPDILLLAARAARRRGAATIFDHHDLSPELFVAKFGGKGPGYRALRVAERVGFFSRTLCCPRTIRSARSPSPVDESGRVTSSSSVTARIRPSSGRLHPTPTSADLPPT